MLDLLRIVKVKISTLPADDVGVGAAAPKKFRVILVPFTLMAVGLYPVAA